MQFGEHGEHGRDAINRATTDPSFVIVTALKLCTAAESVVVKTVRYM